MLEPISILSKDIGELKSRFDALFDTAKLSVPIPELRKKHAELFKLASKIRTKSKTIEEKDYAKEVTTKVHALSHAIFMNSKAGTRKRKHYRKRKTYRK